MKNLIKRVLEFRVLVCLSVTTVSIFLLGAGANNVTTERFDRKASRNTEIKEWHKILNNISDEMPSEYRSEWQEISKTNPELLLKVTGALHYK